jgi:hypothetical protein
MKKIFAAAALALIILCFTALGQEPERIREEVEVINVEVPVRVYYKKKPIKGLKKEDFKLFIGGKEREIHGFYQVQKQIKTSSTTTGSPRLFVLVFNVSSDNPQLLNGLHDLFENVIRPGDRLIVLTNNIYIKEKTVADPQRELEKLKKIVKVETLKMKQVLISLESNMRYMASSFGTATSQEGTRVERDIEGPIARFIDDYRNYFNEFKQRFFNPNAALYLEVAQFLKRCKIEKWVLYFYQAPVFPLLSRTNGNIYETIDQFYRGLGELNPYVFDVELAITKPDKSRVQEISKIFLNTGATFHTLLMSPETMQFIDEFEYRPVAIDSEYVSREAAKLTGGSIIASNNIGKFVKKIAAKEDVYYMLTYVPKKGEGKAKLKVQVSNKKYRLVYDNQQRPKFMERIAKAVKKEMPQIRFRQVDVKDGFIFLHISGVPLAPAEDNKEEKKGKIVLNIKILNPRVQEIAGVKKAFICRAAEIPIRLRLPELKKGRYQMILEVNDLLTSQNDLELKEMKITADHTLEPGQEAFAFIRAPIANAPSPADFNRSTNLDRLSKTIDPEVLPLILKRVADYCKRLQAISLNFFCIEEIDEVVYHVLGFRGSAAKKKPGTRKQLTYGYQLIKENHTPLEKRALFERDGVEKVKENVLLKTRFKYKHIVYGPLIFNKRSQAFYRYRIVDKKPWGEKNAYIVEAVPGSNQGRQFISGRFWVDETDYSILRTEIYQDSLRNFGDIEKMADKRQLEPYITIINEYDIVKKGVRFPSKLYYEEAYKDKRGKLMVQAVGNVLFKDYQFFTVETKVTEERQD